MLKVVKLETFSGKISETVIDKNGRNFSVVDVV
jgi:hypothetical protein